MTDDKNNTLQENVEKRVRSYLVLYVCVPVFIVWSDEILGLMATGLGGRGSSDLAHRTLIFIATVVGTVSGILLNLVRDLSLPVLLDDCLFHVRRTTNRIIEEGLIEYARLLTVAEWQEMRRKRAGLPYLFCCCTREQKELNALSARCWEQYYVNVSLICLGAVSFTVSTVLVLLRCRIDLITASPLGILAIVVTVGFSTRMSLLGRIYALPLQQLVEIRPEEFRREASRRWSSPVTALWRYGEQDRMQKISYALW
ncbi:MAG: hypothetical protein K8I29_01935 [Alphaproteobacteria bacterium]|uniref:Uncharacterized protein n=1 Tax=Candidatus Nitrobium versatile TaxID=2884831 RepID=A0A953J3M6_9BACT|nr:hypothetical protein [Candidatus Nitrobium versatile]